MSSGTKFLSLGDIIEAVTNKVTCPDQSQCPNDSTCCEMSAGQYGCCPIPNAMCCSDGQHCCPTGYTCDVGAGTCVQSIHGEGNLAMIVGGFSSGTVRCDDKSLCPNDNTCCMMTTGAWGCCPLPKVHYYICCHFVQIRILEEAINAIGIRKD